MARGITIRFRSFYPDNLGKAHPRIVRLQFDRIWQTLNKTDTKRGNLQIEISLTNVTIPNIPTATQ
jgi:hypothetical protein